MKKFVLLWVLWGAVTLGFSQSSGNYVTGENSTGVTPIGSYIGDETEHIDLYNLNLNVVIPLFTLKGRNGLDMTVTANYNAIQYDWVEVEGIYDPIQWKRQPMVGAGNNRFSIQLAPSMYFVPGYYVLGQAAYYQNRYILRLPDGTRHELRNKDTDNDVPEATYQTLERFRSTDSSQIEMREVANGAPGTVYLKDGTRIVFSGGQATQLIDTNGNIVTYASLGTGFTDSLGRTVQLTSLPGGGVEVTVREADGQIRTYRLTDSQLVLPSGLSYQFEWVDGIGPLRSPDWEMTNYTDSRLAKITYPLGGYTRYTWGVGEIVTGGEEAVLTGKYVQANDGQGETYWSYSRALPSAGQTTAVRPDGSRSRHTFSQFEGGPAEIRTEFLNSSSTLMRTVNKDWETDAQTVTGARSYNHRVIRETSILENNLQSKVEWSYDREGYLRGTQRLSLGNVVERREFDHASGAPGALLRKTQMSYLAGGSYGLDNLHILDRVTQEIVYDSAGVQKALTNYTYDNYASPRTLIDTSGAVQRASGYGTTYTTRGNLTQVSRWLNTTGGYLNTYLRRDVCGNQRERTDPRGYTELYQYNSTYQFAWPYQVQDARGFIHSFVYDFSNTNKRGFGYLKQRTDPNARITSYTYDLMGREKTVTLPDGGLVTKYYSDTNLTAQHNGQYVFQNRATVTPFRTKVYNKLDSTLDRADLTVYDDLGRVRLNAVTNGSNLDFVRTEYDNVGRLWRTSNPVTLAITTENPGSMSFPKWTSHAYDALDRITVTATQDGQTVTNLYAANTVTATDQAWISRKSTFDALGRLKSALEPNETTGSLTSGSYTTSYTYSALDNLTQVSQGSQTRTFVYDSLGRLTQGTNPESGTTTYSYDASSNLTQKTDARSISVTYTYDELNRPTFVNYSDTTPDVTMGYDSTLVTNGKGRRTSLSDSASGTKTFHYDVMGRTAKIVWSTGHFTQTGEFVYNLAGGVKESKWPGIWDGPTPLTIYWTYDNAGRQKTAWWSNNGGGAFQNLVTGYTSQFNFVSPDTFGTEILNLSNGTKETIQYNERMQPVGRFVENSAGTFLMHLAYSFKKPVTNQNNGNVFAISESVLTGKDQAFTYDYLNRLKTASDAAGSWSATYTYDRYGNRSKQCLTGSQAAKSRHLTISSTTNRITSGIGGSTACSSVPNQSYGHDAAGDLTSEPGWSYQYDAAGRIKTVNSGTTGSYSYDGDGKRVKKVTAAETRYYFHDPAGQPVWEYKVALGWETFNFYFNGKQVASNSAATTPALMWLHSDHLGSPRIKTDAAQVRLSYDTYLPYGEQLNTPSYNIKYRFTGKERDGESNLDYFGARYYANHLGRFTSPDEFTGGPYEMGASQFSKPGPLPFADTTNPQSLNKYAYVFNNPLRYLDPDGHEPLDAQFLFEALRDSFIGYGKEAANTVIGIANTVNQPIDAALSTVTDFQFGQIKEFEATNRVQGNAMLGMAIIGMVGTGGESGGVKLASAIGKDKGLTRFAQEAGTSVQKGIDTLTSQLAKGNLNPGIGTKNLFGNISYARARDGARVFFRRVGKHIEILAKASKKNEADVIKKLKELYK